MLNMNKPNKNVKNSLNLIWLVVTVICVFITYYCMKVKATNNYEQILQVAAEGCNLEITKFLVQDILDINSTSSVSSKTLIHSARGGCLEIIKFFVEKGVDINATNGSTSKRIALHHAAYVGRLEIVKLLLKKGANPNVRDNDEKNPRDMAVIESRHNKDKPYNEIISLLYNADKQYKFE